jgi:hypothetical protein
LGYLSSSHTGLIYILVQSKSDDIEAAFREVVSLDLERILSRLRSRHAKRTRKTAGKRPLIEQLYDAIHSRSIKATNTIKESRRRVQDLQSLFARLESKTDPDAEIIEVDGVVEMVGEIVKQIHAFSLTTDLGLALRTSMIDPTLKAYLPEAIGKLGRYVFLHGYQIGLLVLPCRKFPSTITTDFPQVVR